MVVIAVAGGTGNVGRTIVQALVATGKHEVKILSRKVNSCLLVNDLLRTVSNEVEAQPRA